MGLLSRLKQISTGKLLAFLDDAARPEELVPQLLKELQSQQQALKNAEAKSFAAARAAQKKLEATLGRAVRMERGAELALAKGDEQTAREALREQIQIEKTVPAQQEQVENAQQILDATRKQQTALAHQIHSVKERGHKIEQQLQRPKRAPASKTESHLLRQVAEMEETLTKEELLAEARRELNRHRSLDERLLELERDVEINRRLNDLKEETHKEK